MFSILNKNCNSQCIQDRAALWFMYFWVTKAIFLCSLVELYNNLVIFPVQLGNEPYACLQLSFFLVPEANHKDYYEAEGGFTDASLIYSHKQIVTFNLSLFQWWGTSVHPHWPQTSHRLSRPVRIVFHICIYSSSTHF